MQNFNKLSLLVSNIIYFSYKSELGNSQSEITSNLGGTNDVAEEAFDELLLLDLVVERPLELLHELLVLEEPAALGHVALEASLHLVAALPQRVGHGLGDAVHPLEAELGGGHGGRGTQLTTRLAKAGGEGPRSMLGKGSKLCGLSGAWVSSDL